MQLYWHGHMDMDDENDEIQGTDEIDDRVVDGKEHSQFNPSNMHTSKCETVMLLQTHFETEH
jgi:hypothetical protein